MDNSLPGGATSGTASADETEGVAILLEPRKPQKYQRWHPELWSKWVMTVVVDFVILVNIYVPNDRHEREHFFRGWPWP